MGQNIDCYTGEFNAVIFIAGSDDDDDAYNSSCQMYCNCFTCSADYIGVAQIFAGGALYSGLSNFLLVYVQSDP